MKSLFVALWLVLLCSCSTTPPKQYEWYCEGKTPEEKIRAEKECKYEISKATPAYTVVPTRSLGSAMVYGQMHQANLMQQCMDLKGCVLKEVELIKDKKENLETKDVK